MVRAAGVSGSVVIVLGSMVSAAAQSRLRRLGRLVERINGQHGRAA